MKVLVLKLWRKYDAYECILMPDKFIKNTPNLLLLWYPI